MVLEYFFFAFVRTEKIAALPAEPETLATEQPQLDLDLDLDLALLSVELEFVVAFPLIVLMELLYFSDSDVLDRRFDYW